MRKPNGTLSMQVDVKPIQSPSDLKAFIELPWQIYRNNAQWMPQLRSQLKERLSRSTSPVFDYAEVEFFLARQNGSVVGRIAAIKNENHIIFHDERVGFFGFFECIQDQPVAGALFTKAADWLKSRYLNVMRGPTSYSTNGECGLLIDGFDFSPAIMMSYNLPYYADLVEGFGFKKTKDLLAYEVTDEAFAPDRLGKIVERIKRRRKVVVRPLEKKQIDREIERIREIYNSAWERNWGFVPMTDWEIDYLADELIQIVDPDIVLFAEVEDEPIAFILALPDFNQALRHANGRLFPLGLFKILWHARKIKDARMVAFGVKESHRQQGIDALLYYEAFQASVKKGYRRAELSWILEDNRLMNRALDTMGAKIYKRYRLYDYPLV